MAGLTASAPGARRATLSVPTRSRPLSGIRLSATSLELLGVAAITLGALAIRWPELMSVPRLSDEVEEVRLGLHIARGQELPLVNWMPHIGALFNYLVAAAFLLLGPELGVGRLVVALFGALAVVPVYLLGRSIGGPPVGVIAALLLAASGTHVTVSSHIAYSHSLLPLASTAGLWLLHRAVTRRSGPGLAASGLAFGLAFQLHPSALAIWPGLAAYLAWKGRPLLGRWLLLAGLAALLMIPNLVVFNATTGLRGVEKTVNRSTHYLSGADDVQDDWGGRLRVLVEQLDEWPDRFRTLLQEAAAALGGVLSESIQGNAFLHPVALSYAALTLLGLILLGRRGEWLLGLALLSGALLLSLLNGRIEGIVPRARHYALLLPPAYVAIALALCWFYQAGRRAGRVQEAIAVALSLVVLVAPLLLLHDYYERAYRDQRTNVQLLQVLAAIDADARIEQRVYLDDALLETRILGGRVLDTLTLAMELRGRDFEVFNVKNDRLIGREPNAFRLVILRADSVDQAARRYHLEPISGEPGPSAPLRAFRAYRA